MCEIEEAAGQCDNIDAYDKRGCQEIHVMLESAVVHDHRVDRVAEKQESR